MLPFTLNNSRNVSFIIIIFSRKVKLEWTGEKKICCRNFKVLTSQFFSKKMSEKKPKVIVFDLDYTLWPFWVDTHVTPPFKKSSNGKIVDAHGQTIRYYPHSPEILKKLSEEGYEIGVASRTSEIKGAKQLLDLFGWNKYIKYSEIYPGSKTTHFSKIKNASGVEYKDMIFFDDEQRNINDLTRVGVLSILVRDGVTLKVIEEGLKQFASKS